LARELGKSRLNPRRFAVLNGMAENAIVVHEKVSFSWLAEER
jgi:hypothetical protein